MSNSKKRLWVFFIILLYVVIAVIGFFIAYLVKGAIFEPRQTTHTATSTVTKTVTKTKPVSKLNGWKTYTNSSDHISFAYPATDTIKNSSYGFGVTSLELLSANDTTDFQILLMPESIAQAVGQNFDSYYAMSANMTTTIKSPLSSNSVSEKFTKIQNNTVNGLRSVDFQSIASNAKPGTQPEIGTFIEAGNNLILFSTGDGNKTKLEQMVNSFSYQQ
jgi:cytoskeletal protein RodZ